ncbi:cell division protein ZapA [Altererythrobacter salegens]|uniref:Cell division protein ZapA n=1 Tax=Croceibacterium salegens TaxID=1737568 RepID=A0A6I4SS06_9SPHN|nr:cell division protein ZapA [Croceibacterium salegens]MXO58704.1 cell division protein ZapA [Croceibacterium salegens]
MSNVTIDIAGRKFTVACGEGEEPHIKKLGAIIDGKINEMPGLASQSEARCLLYAALLLADENFELSRSQPDLATPLEALADKLEHVAARLEANAG